MANAVNDIVSPIVSPILSGATNFVGNLTGQNQITDAANRAAATQSGQFQEGIDVSKAALQDISGLNKPYTDIGASATSALSNALGLSGADSQANFLGNLSNSPLFKSLIAQSEEAILRNASATGNLRGGNVKSALATNSSNIFNQLINDQINKYMQAANVGQQSAANIGNAQMNTAGQISNLLTGRGDAQAQAMLVAGQQPSRLFNNLLQAGATAYGAQK